MGVNRKRAGLAGHLSVNIQRARSKGLFAASLAKHNPVMSQCASGFTGGGQYDFRVDIPHIFVPMMFVLGVALLGVLQVCLCPSRGREEDGETSVYIQDQPVSPDQGPPPGMSIQQPQNQAHSYMPNKSHPRANTGVNTGVNMSPEQMYNSPSHEGIPMKNMAPPSPSAQSHRSEPVFLT